MIPIIPLPDDAMDVAMADRAATARIEDALQTATPQQRLAIWRYMDGWCAGGKTMTLMDAEHMLAFLATGVIQGVMYHA